MGNCKTESEKGVHIGVDIAHRCHNPLTVLKPMWQSYIQPTFLYGMEIIDYNKARIKELETIQRNLLRIVLRVIPGMATSAVYAVT